MTMKTLISMPGRIWLNRLLRWAILGAGLAGFALSTSTVYGQTTDPLIGSWKLNHEGSRFVGPPPRSQTISWEGSGDSLTFRIRGINAAGAPIALDATGNDDGRDYPVKGSQFIDTFSIKRVSARILERTDRKDGSVIQTQKIEISPDGKTMTVAGVFLTTSTELFELQGEPSVQDPNIGVWQLNVGKSRYSFRAPQDETVIWQPLGSGVKVINRFTNAAGSSSEQEFTAEYDGKYYPVKGSTFRDSGSLRRVDPRTTERVFRKGDDVVMVLTRVISTDGRTALVNGTYYGRSRLVYDKE